MVQVINSPPPAQNAPQQITTDVLGVTIHWEIIIPIVILGIIILVVLSLLIWGITKIVKKIRGNAKIKNDLEYRKYALDLKNAFLNKNPRYKRKSVLTLFMLWKKAKVYFRTSSGKKFAGYYDGELVKKEGYFVLALELRYTFFKRETDLVFFPYELKDKLIFFNDDGTIEIEAEGIDETLSSEYFSLPVFKLEHKHEKEKLFADFSNALMERYFKEYVYRNVIKQNMLDFASNIHEATEMNASVPYKRKTGNDLSE